MDNSESIECSQSDDLRVPVTKIDATLKIIGTAHVSNASVNTVREEIEQWQPDIVAVELCKSRHSALTENKRLDKESLLTVIKEGKAPLVLIQSMLAAEQRKLGMDEGLQPGAEMMEALSIAKENGKRVELVDRDVQTTLRRAWSKMSLREKYRLLWSMVGEDDEDDDDISIDEILQNKDLMSEMMNELRDIAPRAGEVLVDERDEYIARKIQKVRSEGKVLAVIGAGHVEGVSKYLQNNVDLSESRIKELDTPPKPSKFWKIFQWAIPAIFIGLVAWFAWNGDSEKLIQIFTIWTAANAIMAAIGVILARGHILSVLVAALASPITSLNPMLAAGWFAGYVQMKMDSPNAQDLQEFLKLDKWELYWKNPAGKVLLVTALGNLGSMSGAWIAGFIIGGASIF